MSFTVIIPARLKSSRLPDKPLADICGRPMIVRVAERALSCGADRVVVAVDDASVYEACAAAGLDVIMTDPHHPTGTDRLAEAVAKKLAAADEAHYGEAARRLAIKAQRAAERRQELKQHEKNLRAGKKKPKAREETPPEPKKRAESGTEEKKPARRPIRHGRTRAEREKAHRAAEKQRAAKRFAHARPVKKGKGSVKKDSKQRSQHTEVQ